MSITLSAEIQICAINKVNKAKPDRTLPAAERLYSMKTHLYTVEMISVLSGVAPLGTINHSASLPHKTRKKIERVGRLITCEKNKQTKCTSSKPK